MSNSNFNITKVVVDPVSQEISSLEVNGKEIQTGGKVEEVKTIENLNISGWFDPEAYWEPITIEPSEGYDSIKKVEIDDITGYPEYQRVLISKMYDSENDTYETFAFEEVDPDPSALVTSFADYIKRNGKTWKFNPGMIGFVLESSAAVTIGLSAVSVEISPNTYTNADLNDFSFAYIPKSN